MRAFVMEGFGATEKAHLAEKPMPVAGPDDLVVKVAGAGVNPSDFKEVQGYLTGYYPEYVGPWIIGHDGAGIVDSVGANVSALAVGDRVMFLSNREAGRQSGTFCEYALVDRRFVARAPEAISLLEASTIPVAAGTALQALFRSDVGNAQAGQSVLLHGAAGGLGSFAVALCRESGLRIAATCRSANAAYVRDLGAARVIDYRAENVAEATREWSDGGVDVVLDCVSGGHDLSLLDGLKSGGRLVVISTADHDSDPALLHDAAAKRGVSAFLFVLDVATIIETLDDLRHRIDAGMKMPHVSAYPLAQAGEALAAMEAGGVVGKIAVEIAKLG